MLLQLRVQNFALIEEVEIRFGEGFNVLSGETGVGKSILIDAVKLLLGDRASSYDIRYGTEAALVEGVFSEPDDHMLVSLERDFGLTFEPGDPLILSREVRSNGRNICRVNGRTLTLSQYRAFSQPLVNIFGQHDHQQINDAASQRDYLDAFGGPTLLETRARVARAYSQAQESGRKFKKVIQQKRRGEKHIEKLTQDIQVLEAANLVKGEEAEVRGRHSQLAHAEALEEILSGAYQFLYGGENSVYGRLAQTTENLQEGADIHRELSTFAERLESQQIQTQEIAFEIQQFRQRIMGDPGELVRLEERLALFDRLSRQYDKDVDALIDWMASAKAEIAAYESLDLEMKEAQDVYQQEREIYQREALVLRELRKEQGAKLSSALLQELGDLAMGETQFEISFEPTSGDASGMDAVTFLFSTNPGMPCMPVAEIASGGEMSRIMLALQTILGESEGTATLIFDEIDTGIGGMVLGKVAQKLATVAQHHQVICVTHAPAIAALAEDLFAVEKRVVGESTRTLVTHITEEHALLEEIARMLGGYDNWHLEHAQKLRSAKDLAK